MVMCISRDRVMSNGDERLRAVLGEYSNFLRDKELVLTATGKQSGELR